MAKFYGIGTGPGDSSLLTLKAVEILNKIDILYTPEAAKGGESFAYSIVEPHIKKELHIKQRHFPMTFNTTEKLAAWEAVAREVIEDVKAGKDVGFITLGDPMIYSTYVYIMERLIGEIEVETIPGISSFSNIASSQNFPLVMDREPLMVLPCTASEEQIDYALANYKCLVLMKVYRNFEKIIKKLEENKVIDDAILVSNSSLESEEVYTDLREVGLKDKISYFSTILLNKSSKSLKE